MKMRGYIIPNPCNIWHKRLKHLQHKRTGQMTEETPHSTPPQPPEHQPERSPVETAKALLQRAKAAFTEHPAEAGESYGQHLLFTVGMAFRLIVCSFVLIIHGIFPFMCCHSASRKMKKCQSVMAERAKMTGCPEENAPKAE